MKYSNDLTVLVLWNCTKWVKLQTKKEFKSEITGAIDYKKKLVTIWCGHINQYESCDVLAISPNGSIVII